MVATNRLIHFHATPGELDASYCFIHFYINRDTQVSLVGIFQLNPTVGSFNFKSYEQDVMLLACYVAFFMFDHGYTVPWQEATQTAGCPVWICSCETDVCVPSLHVFPTSFTPPPPPPSPVVNCWNGMRTLWKWMMCVYERWVLKGRTQWEADNSSLIWTQHMLVIPQTIYQCDVNGQGVCMCVYAEQMGEQCREWIVCSDL